MADCEHPVMTDSTPLEDPVVVAIDGPAGSGKSSVSKRVARQLGYGYLDTGAIYRALAWTVLESGVDTADVAAVLTVFSGFDPSISLEPADFAVAVGSADVTEAIREPRISAAASAVARISAVREGLNASFRQWVAQSGRPGVVVEGRDITTVVAPDAAARILLTADPAVRAARRSAELSGHDAARVAEALRQRDASDSAVVDFLTAADGVSVVDSTHLDLEQTVSAVLDVVDQRIGARDGR